MRVLSFLFVFIIATSILMDAPAVESLLVKSYGPRAVLLTVNRTATVQYCFAIEHFQPPMMPTPFGGTSLPNPRVGEPLPLTDIKTCQASLSDVLVNSMRVPVVPWPVPFIVSPQQ